MIRLRITPTIVEEWVTRGIADVIPNLPDAALDGGNVSIPIHVARAILMDCDAFGEDGDVDKDLRPIVRLAYLALACQIRMALDSHHAIFNRKNT